MFHTKEKIARISVMPLLVAYLMMVFFCTKTKHSYISGNAENTFCTIVGQVEGNHSELNARFCQKAVPTFKQGWHTEKKMGGFAPVLFVAAILFYLILLSPKRVLPFQEFTSIPLGLPDRLPWISRYNI